MNTDDLRIELKEFGAELSKGLGEQLPAIRLALFALLEENKVPKEQWDELLDFTFTEAASSLVAMLHSHRSTQMQVCDN